VVRGGDSGVTRANPFRIVADRALDPRATSFAPPAQERRHLEVRRATPGQSIEVLDGQGSIAIGRLAADGTIAIEKVERVARPPGLMLVVGAGDRDRFLWLVEKCVEVGVTDLVPVDTERSRQVATRIRAEHHERLDRRATEALKQSGGAWGLVIHPVMELEAGLALVDADRRWLADPRGAPPDLGPAPTTVAAAVGPEGGFTESEMETVQAAGFAPTRLGLRTLRFETAALAAAMIVRLEGRERDGD
jgi:16S rRNA (uracil1498-N3)-methyltransferase